MSSLAKAQRGRKSAYKESLSVIELLERYPDEDSARRWFERVRWGKKLKGLHCPYCLSWNVDKTPNHKTMHFRCRRCRKYFSVRTNTPMQGSKLPYRTWLLAIYDFVDHPKGVSALQTHRYLGVTRKTAWFLNHRIREGLDVEDVDEDGEIECYFGPVEIDETYIGGKARNMHHEARKRNREKHEYGKAIVVGLRDRKTKRVKVLLVTKANRKQLHQFIYDRTFKETQVYTDDAKAYKKLKRPHKAVNHSKWQFADGDCSTNGIESFWAIVKRGHKGTYHSWSHKHLQRYLNEFVCRHNMLHLGTLDQMKEVARGMVGKRLLYRELTGRVQSR